MADLARTEPQLPIERLRIDRLLRPVPLIVLPPVSSHLHHAAQTPSLDQINRVAKVCPTPLLHTALQNLLARTDRTSQHGAFLQSVGDRLLEIYVLASF